MTSMSGSFLGVPIGLVLTISLLGAGEVDANNGLGYIPLTDGRPYVHVIHEGRSIKVRRVQDPGYELRGHFARTVRQCPPFCIRPIEAAPGVKTLGEIEVFDFMERELRDGEGMLVDVRTPAWFKQGTIPGSVNLPFTNLSQSMDNPMMVETLEFFGAKERGRIGLVNSLMEDFGLTDTRYLTRNWDFTRAKKLLLWSNGPTSGQAPRAIDGLLALGYPADKLFYYRGGMQMWQVWGLTTVVPK